MDGRIMPLTACKRKLAEHNPRPSLRWASNARALQQQLQRMPFIVWQRHGDSTTVKSITKQNHKESRNPSQGKRGFTNTTTKPVHVCPRFVQWNCALGCSEFHATVLPFSHFDCWRLRLRSKRILRSKAKTSSKKKLCRFPHLFKQLFPSKQKLLPSCPPKSAHADVTNSAMPKLLAKLKPRKKKTG